jgi:hypothetical protein
VDDAKILCGGLALCHNAVAFTVVTENLWRVRKPRDVRTRKCYEHENFRKYWDCDEAQARAYAEHCYQRIKILIINIEAHVREKFSTILALNYSMLSKKLDNNLD